MMTPSSHPSYTHSHLSVPAPVSVPRPDQLSPCTFSPIGLYRCSAHFPQQAPRQATQTGAVPGRIELNAGCNFETALRDLAGFDRIWLICVFHRAQGWRPTARPPIPPPQGDRVGLFASRSPYRPNPIGLSSVRLLSIHGLVIEVEGADLLDETPVLDIKPYIPAFDSFADSRAGWLEGQLRQEWHIAEKEPFADAAKMLLLYGGPDIVAACRTQLAFNPFDASRKRVEWKEPQEDDRTVVRGTFRFRTWIVDIAADTGGAIITLENIRSSYTNAELANPDDRYADKEVHRLWRRLRTSPGG